MNKSELKEAIIEVLEDNPEILEKAFVNTLEEIAMINAIEEGDRKNYIEFDKFMKYLNDKLKTAKSNED